MQTGGVTIAAGYEGCIFSPKLNVDPSGLATDSDDFTNITKAYMIESSFINERDMLTRVNAITGGRGVINILGTDIIKSFPEDYNTEMCSSIKSKLTPINITTDNEGKQTFNITPSQTSDFEVVTIDNLSNFFSDTSFANAFNLSSKLKVSFTSIVFDSLGSKEFSSIV